MWLRERSEHFSLKERLTSTRRFSGRSSNKNSLRHMRSEKFLITASKNFAGRKVEMVSTSGLTTVFAEFFDQSSCRISPARTNFILESKSSFSHSLDEINPCRDQKQLFAANV